MKTRNIGQILYAILFTIIVPVGLWYWGYLTSRIVTWPAIQSPLLGISLVIIGFLLLLWGMWALFYFGQGLPMNAFPPKKYVVDGPYKLFKHPIYVGFAFIMTGYSLYIGASSLL
ncbi:MAG: methyltransferase, partial [Bacteroidota bacterium]